MPTKAEYITQYENDPQYATIYQTIDGVQVALSAAERTAKIDSWADGSVESEARVTDAEAKKELRRQVRLALDLLERTTNPATLAQVRTILAGLIRAMIDLNLIENE